MDQPPNRRARLACALIRSAWAPLRWQRVALMAALALATAGCAIWAVALQHQATRQPETWVSLFDYLYAPFLYLVPQGNFAYATKLSLPEAVARIIGPLLSLLSLFWLARRRLLVAAADLLLDYGARGHAIILADHGSGDALALASAAAGDIVVLADASVVDEEDRLALLGAAGIACRGALPKSLARAGTLVLWQASDADNIASATSLRTGHDIGAREIHLSVRAVELHRALLQVPDLMLDKAVRLRPHSVAGDAMRAALAGPDLPALAVTRHEPRVTLCLWGISDALIWAAEIALRQSWSVQLGAPRVVWAGGAPDAPLPEALAHLVHHAAPVFGVGAMCPVVERMTADAACADAGISCHLVDAGDADATLAQAFALAARLRQLHVEPAPVRPILNVACAIGPLFTTDKLVFLPPVIPAAGVTLDALRNREADQAAAEIHLAYDRAFGGGGTAPASGRWQDLPETYVAANRAAADHVAIKRWDAATSGLVGDALIEALAEAEHSRWSTDRLLAGWSPAGDAARDNARRLHPDLRAWDELTEEARQKDRAAVTQTLAGIA